MDAKARKVDIFFFLFLGGGHLIPMINLARVFASHRGITSTIVTIPSNATVFHHAVTCDQNSNLDIRLHILDLPIGVYDDENLPAMTSADMSATPSIDTSALSEPLVQLLRHCRSDCLVADTFHRWVPDAIDAIGVPRVIFSGNCCFSRCCEDSIRRYEPHEKVGSDLDPFLLPGLLDRIEMTVSQLPIFAWKKIEFLGKAMRAEHSLKNFSVVFLMFLLEI